MRKLVFSAAGAVCLGLATPAMADGMYEGSMKDAPAPMPVHIWAGLYVGGSAGFGVGDTSGQLEFDIDDRIRNHCSGDNECVAAMHELSHNAAEYNKTDDYNAVAFEEQFSISEIESFLESVFKEEYDVDGAIYGAHIGYNWQHGHTVFGLEAGINGTDMDGSSNCGVVLNLPTCQRELDYYGTFVGRLGYAVNNLLFYGFGGVAWGEVETDVSIFGETLFDGSETHVGWTAGLGLEVALTDRFFVGVEYAHVDLGEETFNVVDEEYIKIDNEVDVDFDVFKVRASYKLWDPAHQPIESFK